MDLHDQYLKQIEEQLRKGLPEGTLPETINPSALSELTSRPEFKPAPYNPNFAVHESNSTVKMEGRPESLPSSSAIPPAAQSGDTNLDFEYIGDPVEEQVPASSRPDEAVTSPAKEPVKETKLEDVFKEPSDNDRSAREKGMADLESKRKWNVVPQAIAGFGDAVAAGVSAKGGNMPMGALKDVMERQDKDYEAGKKGIEDKLRNDPNSDISKQYQELVARFMQKEPGDPALLGLTANQIAEKIPQIEKLASMRQQEDLNKLRLEAMKESKAARLAEQKSKQDDKADAAKQGLVAQNVSMNMKLDDGINTVDDALKKVGALSTGPLAPDWGVNPKYQSLKGDIETLGGKILLDTLLETKKQSAMLGSQGAGFGALSDAEGKALKASIAALNQSLYPEDLKTNLNKVKTHMQRMKALANLTPEQMIEVSNAYKTGNRVSLNKYFPSMEKPASTPLSTKSGRSFTKGE